MIGYAEGVPAAATAVLRFVGSHVATSIFAILVWRRSATLAGPCAHLALSSSSCLFVCFGQMLKELMTMGKGTQMKPIEKLLTTWYVDPRDR